MEAARRWAAAGIAVNALNPGRIQGTNLSRHLAAPPVPYTPGVRRGVAAYALDPQKAQRLWQLSLDRLATLD